MDLDLNISGIASPSSGGAEIPVKVLILGSGPAGFSAALYAARADLNPVVLTGMELGGQVSLTYIVENYPGFPEGIGGQQLVELFQKQAERFGARVEFDTATKVDLSQRPFRVTTYNATYLADALIIATGATPRHLNVPGEKELTGRGVSYCATCDGMLYKGKKVVVVALSPEAEEEAKFLTSIGCEVTTVKTKKIAVNSEGAEGMKKVVSVTADGTDIPCEAVFILRETIAPGSLLPGLETEKGHIKTDRAMKTNLPGVFAAGDCTGAPYQVAKAVGEGQVAVLSAVDYLAHLEKSQ